MFYIYIFLIACLPLARLVENIPPTDRAKPQAATSEDGTEIVMEIDVAESHVVLDAILEEEIETISRCLEEIARIFSNVDNLIVSIPTNFHSILKLGCFFSIDFNFTYSFAF